MLAKSVLIRCLVPLLVIVASAPAMAAGDQVRRPKVTVPSAAPTSPQQTMGAQTDAEKQAEENGNPVAGGDPAGEPPPSDTPPPPLEQAAPMPPIHPPSYSQELKQPSVVIFDGIASVNGLPTHFTLTPGDYVVVAGRGFGDANGLLEVVLPGFPNNPTPLTVSSWSDGTVKAQLPVGITGVLDGPLKLRLTTPGQQQFESKSGNFKARRQAYLVTNNIPKYLSFPQIYESGPVAGANYGVRDDGTFYSYTAEVVLGLNNCEGTDHLTAKALPGGFVVDSIELEAPPLRGPNIDTLPKFQQSQLYNDYGASWYRGSFAVQTVAPGQFHVRHACQRRGSWPDYKSLLKGVFSEYAEDDNNRIPYVSAYRVRVKLFGPVGTQPPF